MAKNKRKKAGRAFNAAQYRAAVHREVTLPSCGMQISVRPLTLEEVRLVLERYPDAVAEIERLKEQDAQLSDGALVGAAAEGTVFLEYTRGLICEASVCPLIVPEPTQAADRICVRELTPEDFNAILRAAIPQEEIHEAARIAQELRRMQRELQPAAASSEQADDVNEQVAAVFTSPAMIQYMTGKPPAEQ
jgi:hypothetical protein